ncbi:MAG: hypothetical protein JO256_11045 [Alphaproteobacteria bacterium]|nr:hypothetical protein [Alphaproteobacteria bacterium]
MRLTPAIFALIHFCCPALAQAPPVAFAPVTGVPVPLQSVSGRFSSLNPLNQHACPEKRVSGRIVSPRLILVRDLDCGRPGHDNLLINVQLANPADAARMVPGARAVITGTFKSAEEDRDPVFVAEFLIAQQAQLVSVDRTTAPAPPFTSYMLCQPPELDALATRLGSELCVQNTLLTNLADTSSLLEIAARAPAKLAPQDAMPGDAGAISCRLDPGVSDRNLSSIACARNSYWSWYQRKWHDPLFSDPAPP